MNTVTDFEIFIKNGSVKSNLSDDLLRSYIIIQKIIKSSLSKPTGLWADSDIKCRDLHIGKKCEGTINIKKIDIPHKIIWECTSCSISGEILNWRKSPLYREYTKSNGISGKKPIPNLILHRNDYNDLKMFCSGDIDFWIIINSAKEINNYFHINIAEFDILRILGYISEKIDSSSPDKVKLSDLRHALLDSYSPSPGKTAFY